MSQYMNGRPINHFRTLWLQRYTLLHVELVTCLLLQQLPYPSYERDSFLQVVDFFLTMFFVLSLIYTAGVVVKVTSNACISYSTNQLLLLPLLGVSARERITCKGNHEDDGLEQLGADSYMVSQAAHLSILSCFDHYTILKGLSFHVNVYYVYIHACTLHLTCICIIVHVYL